MQTYELLNFNMQKHFYIVRLLVLVGILGFFSRAAISFDYESNVAILIIFVLTALFVLYLLFENIKELLKLNKGKDQNVRSKRN